MDAQAREAPTSAQEFRRAWTVVLAAMIGVSLCVTGLPNYSIGLFIEPLSKEFGWSRSAISLWSFWQMGTLAIVTPLVGWLIDRYGTRPIALISIPLFSAAIAAMSLLKGDIKSLYLGAVLTSVLGGGTIVSLYSKTVNGWFRAARGSALGIMGAGIGLISIFGPRLVQIAIDHLGWRAGFLFIALAALMALPSAYFLLFENRPARASSAAAVLPGMTRKAAVNTPIFWLLALSFALISMLTNGLMVSLVPYLTDSGMTRAAAASYTGLFGVSSLVGRIVTGFLFDRTHAPPVCAVVYLLAALATAVLAIFGAGCTGVCIVIVGFALGSETDALGYFTARYFGLRSYGEIAALFAVGMALGNSVGPFAINFLWELSGGYFAPFLTFSILAGVAAVLMVFLGRRPFLQAT